MEGSALILLDTHVLVWAKMDRARLTKKAANAILDARKSDGLAISAITLWELGMLLARGRIQGFGAIEASVRAFAEGATIKPITVEIASLSAQFSGDFPGDPADRIIAATSLAEQMPLITRDERMRSIALLHSIW